MLEIISDYLESLRYLKSVLLIQAYRFLIPLRNVKDYPHFVRYFSDHQLSQYEKEGIVSTLIRKVLRKYFGHLFSRKKH